MLVSDKRVQKFVLWLRDITRIEGYEDRVNLREYVVWDFCDMN